MSKFVFPQPEKDMAGNPIKGTQRGGLTKRELFAAMSLQGLLVNNGMQLMKDMLLQNHPKGFTSLAGVSVALADALLVELLDSKQK